MRSFILILLATFCINMLINTKTAFSRVMDEEEANLFANFISTVVKTSNGTNKGGICVIGSDEISKMLAVNNSKILDLNSNQDSYSKCSAIYVAKDKQKTIKTQIEKYNQKKVMTISTFDGFVEINGLLEVQMGRRSFELVLNSKLAKQTGIRLNALAMDLVIN